MDLSLAYGSGGGGHGLMTAQAPPWWMPEPWGNAPIHREKELLKRRSISAVAVCYVQQALLAFPFCR